MSVRLVVDGPPRWLLTMLGEGPDGWGEGTISDAIEIADDYRISVDLRDMRGRYVCRVLPGGEIRHAGEPGGKGYQVSTTTESDNAGDEPAPMPRKLRDEVAAAGALVRSFRDPVDDVVVVVDDSGADPEPGERVIRPPAPARPFGKPGKPWSPLGTTRPSLSTKVPPPLRRSALSEIGPPPVCDDAEAKAIRDAIHERMFGFVPRYTFRGVTVDGQPHGVEAIDVRPSACRQFLGEWINGEARCGPDLPENIAKREVYTAGPGEAHCPGCKRRIVDCGGEAPTALVVRADGTSPGQVGDSSRFAWVCSSCIDTGRWP